MGRQCKSYPVACLASPLGLISLQFMEFVDTSSMADPGFPSSEGFVADETVGGLPDQAGNLTEYAGDGSGFATSMDEPA